MGKVTMNDIMFQIHDMVKSNQDILKLLYYTDNTINPLEQKPLTREQAEEVIKKNIYRSKKIPLESENIQGYICMTYGQKLYHHPRNYIFTDSTFNFYIFCHNNYDTNKIIGSRICELERLFEDMFDLKEMVISKPNNEEIRIMTEMLPSIDDDINGTSYNGRHLRIRFSDCSGKTYGQY